MLVKNENLSSERQLIIRTLLKVFSFNAQSIIPISGIDIVKIIGSWYEELNIALSEKNMRAFKRLLDVIA